MTAICRECHLPKPEAWTGADLIREIDGVFAKADCQTSPAQTAAALDMGLRLLRANAAGYCNGCAVVAVTAEMMGQRIERVRTAARPRLQVVKP